MSMCISSTGKHTYNDNDWCYHCGYNTLRDKLALIEVTVALWEAGAVEMDSEAGRFTEFPRTQSSMWARADTNRSHAESIRDILKGE